MVADWLRFEIASGLQKLLALRLMGTPPEDAIVGTDTALGFSRGDIAPFLPGCRFHIFDNN